MAMEFLAQQAQTQHLNQAFSGKKQMMMRGLSMLKFRIVFYIPVPIQTMKTINY